MVWSKAKSLPPRRRLIRQADLAHLGKRENPFKPEVPKSHKSLILGFIGLLSVLGVGSLTFFHPAFQVDVIAITGATRTDYTDLQKTVRQILDTKIWWVIPGSNYFLLDKQGIIEVIQNRFRLQSVEVIKTFPHALEIKITERGPQIITVQGGVVTALDPDGAEVLKLGRLQTALSYDLKLVIAEARLIQGSSPELYKPLPLVVLTTSTSDVISSSDLIAGVLAWNSFLHDNGQQADYFVVNARSEGETVLSKSGTKLLVNFIENRDRQFLAASTFWKQTKVTSTIQYLDLRYPGKIFWK